MTETIVEKKISEKYFEFLVWLMSYPLLWRRRGLWLTYTAASQPGRSRCFGFTMRELSGCPSLYKVYGESLALPSLMWFNLFIITTKTPYSHVASHILFCSSCRFYFMLVVMVHLCLCSFSTVQRRETPFLWVSTTCPSASASPSSNKGKAPLHMW